jgi:hypothetical protein
VRRVIIESPFAGHGATPEERAADAERKLRYARACLADSLARGEAPLASHLLYTQPGVLDDAKPEEREKGIKAGFAWRCLAEATVFCVDLGMSPGMIAALEDAQSEQESSGAHDIEIRRLGGEWAP